MAIGQQQSARLARYNRAVVLDLIRRLGPTSKSELAERSGLAVSSVLNILASLSRRGLIREVGFGPSTGGRPPTLIELDPEAHFAIGVNIRPTYVEAVLIDLVGDIRSETVLPAQGGRDPESVAGTVVEAVGQVIRFGRVDLARVLGVAVGCPGPVTAGRIVVGTPGLPGWEGVELADRLETLLGLPVMLENDANLGALGEYRHGAWAKQEHHGSLIYLYADHGVGSGIVIDGSLYRGVDGAAGEIGHTVIDVDGPPCVCGNYGCLEAVASVGAIIRRTVAASKLGGTSSLVEGLGGDWDAVSFEAVMEAVDRQDPIATAALDEAISYLAICVSNVCRQFRPDIIVVGGQLFEHGGTTFDRLKAALERRPTFFGTAMSPVVLGDLGARAACVGAATLVLENFFGVAHQVMTSEPLSQVPQPAFEHPLVWPARAEDGVVLVRGNVGVDWAGDLRASTSKVRTGEPVTIMVDVKLDSNEASKTSEVKALLHWDRVALFGGNWTNPKNSPMHLISADGGEATFGVTLGSLPPGKYEYAAHVLGSNDVWVRTANPVENTNGRVEVIPSRAAVFEGEIDIEPKNASGKEAGPSKEQAVR